MKSYYEILGVASSATQPEIKDRYRFLANAYHPDKFPSAEQKAKAEAEFKEINAAYQVLSVPAKRAEYDRRLGRPAAPNSSHGQQSQPHPQQSKKAGDIQAAGQMIIRTIMFAFVFYVASFIALRMGIMGVVLFLILLAIIYSKYFWK